MWSCTLFGSFPLSVLFVLRQSRWPFLCLRSLRLFLSHLPVTGLSHSHPLSFNFPHYLSLQISFLLPVWLMSHTEREGTATAEEIEGRKESGARGEREGWVSQTCHQAVRIPQGPSILFFCPPPPPRLTHHAARTHDSQTLKYIQYSSFSKLPAY